jgi:hypothetical protein
VGAGLLFGGCWGWWVLVLGWWVLGCCLVGWLFVVRLVGAQLFRVVHGIRSRHVARFRSLHACFSKARCNRLHLSLAPFASFLAPDFYAEHYGIGSMQDSALQVLDLALAAHRDDCKVRWGPGCAGLVGAGRRSGLLDRWAVMGTCWLSFVKSAESVARLPLMRLND